MADDAEESEDSKLEDGWNREIATQIILAEYAALRQEIGRYQDHQKQIMNFVVIVVGGALAIVVPGVIRANPLNQRVLDVLLVVPVFCCLLCVLYYDRTLRILRLAHYLSTSVNQKASKLSGIQTIWAWEIYKRETTIVNRKLALWVDRVRWFMFLLPSVAFPVLFFTFGGSFKGNTAGLVFLIVDGVVVVSTSAVVLKVEETRGVGSAEFGTSGTKI